MHDKFCHAPWSSLYVDPQGRIKPCCVSFQELGNVAKGDSLVDAYASPELTKIREEMLEGKQPFGCRICYNKEMMGIRSRRSTYTPVALKEGAQFEAKGDPDYVTILDISFSNICNLKCKFCGPFCSSKWIEDAKKMPDDPTNMWEGHKERDWKIWQVRAEDMLQQVSQFPNVNMFDINGGEPFLSSEHLKFLQMLVANGRAAHTRLIYTTNGTVNNPEFLEALKHFKDVKIAISSEGTGNTYRYSRGHDGAEDQLETTIRFYSHLPNIRLAIHYTVGALNIFGIRDFLEWYEPMKNKFNVGLTIGVVVAPAALQVQNLPKWFRQTALEQIPTGDDPILNRLRRILSEDARTQEFPVPEEKRLDYFWQFVRDIDRVQGTSLTEMLPLYALIEPKSHAGSPRPGAHYTSASDCPPM